MKIKTLSILFITCIFLTSCNNADSVEANATVESIESVEAVTEIVEPTTIEKIESTVEIETTTEIETVTTVVEETTVAENSLLDGLSDEELAELEKEAAALGTTPEALAKAKEYMQSLDEKYKQDTQIDVDVPGGTPASEATEEEYHVGQGGELPDDLKGKHIY